MFSIQQNKSVFLFSLLFSVLSACGGALGGKSAQEPVGNASRSLKVSSKSQASSLTQISSLASSIVSSSLSP